MRSASANRVELALMLLDHGNRLAARPGFGNLVAFSSQQDLDPPLADREALRGGNAGCLPGREAHAARLDAAATACHIRHSVIRPEE